jgi:hypothetical protein
LNPFMESIINTREEDLTITDVKSEEEEEGIDLEIN